jgi:cytosine/adenosine deaminase-related metal-dependent hydrolase
VRRAKARQESIATDLPADRPADPAIGDIPAGDVLIEDGVIAAVAPSLGEPDAEVIDASGFSHCNNTPRHADAAIAGLRDAGIRAVFGYGFFDSGAGPRDPASRRSVRADLNFRFALGASDLGQAGVSASRGSSR